MASGWAAAKADQRVGVGERREWNPAELVIKRVPFGSFLNRDSQQP